jgi:hypothetical protein
MPTTPTEHHVMKAPPEVREVVRHVVAEQPGTVERQVAESARRFWDLPDVGNATGLARQLVNLAIRQMVYDARREWHQKRSDQQAGSGTGMTPSVTPSGESGMSTARPTA